MTKLIEKLQELQENKLLTDATKDIFISCILVSLNTDLSLKEVFKLEREKLLETFMFVEGCEISFSYLNTHKEISEKIYKEFHSFLESE